MSVLIRLISILCVALLVSGCNNDDKAHKIDPKVDEQENKNCIPESKLNQGIVGGERVHPTDADANTVMLLYIGLQEGAEICTAAPIAPNILLTAAHCISGLAKDSFVALYTSLSCESGFDIRYNTVKVSKFIVHEKFKGDASPDKMVGDVALVFLDKQLPIEYPIYKIANPDELTSQNEIYFYGYGVTGYKKGGSGMLRKTQLPRADFSIDKKEMKVKIDQSHGRGLCQGDSGGPGLVNINGELQILGVNSYVSSKSTDADACQSLAYLVLADSYKSWIENKLKPYGIILK